MELYSSSSQREKKKKKRTSSSVRPASGTEEGGMERVASPAAETRSADFLSLSGYSPVD